MDYLIAVTDNDAVNIFASLLADRCGIPQKIARVRSLDVLKPGALITAADRVWQPAVLAKHLLTCWDRKGLEACKRHIELNVPQLAEVAW